MIKTKLLLIVTVLACLVPSAWALNYNQNVTAIFGTGNPDTGWTTDVSDNLQVALRAKNRTTGDTTNVNGVYSYATGTVSGGKAVWNFEFSVNSNFAGTGGNLADNSFQYVLFYDTDPSANDSLTSLNLSLFPDNYYGDSSTANGAGISGSYALATSNSILQNSENFTFFPFLGNPNVDGIYDYHLGVYSSTDLTFSNPLAFTSIRVIVGAPSVPDSGTTVALLGLSMIGLAVAGRRMRFAKG
ncbi:MAG: VPDSG-CTERM sorting domain-containing protein [Chthoniobacterales bacterium]